MFATEHAGDDAAAPSALAQQSLYSWRVIDGGFEGNRTLGMRHVRFKRPVQVAARGDYIFVVDAGVDLLYRYDLARDQLTALLDLSSVTAGEVTDLYVNPDHSFLLVDPTAAKVLYFNRDGELIRTFEDPLNLIRPISVTYDEEMGRVLIADGSSDDVLVFTTTGQLQGVIGTRGLQEGQFLNITSIASGGDGIYITSRLGYRLQVMGRDGSHVRTLQRDTVVFPLAVAVDGSLNAFVSDYLDNTIKVYRDGLFIESIGGSGAGPGRFKRITDLWYDNGFIYAVDSLNGRIQILRVEIVEAPVIDEEDSGAGSFDAVSETDSEVSDDAVEVIPVVLDEVDSIDVIEGEGAAPDAAPVEVAPEQLDQPQSDQPVEVPPVEEQGVDAPLVDDKNAAEIELEETRAELEAMQTELEAARAELEAAKQPATGTGEPVETVDSVDGAFDSVDGPVTDEAVDVVDSVDGPLDAPVDAADQVPVNESGE